MFMYMYMCSLICTLKGLEELLTVVQTLLKLHLMFLSQILSTLIMPRGGYVNMKIVLYKPEYVEHNI